MPKRARSASESPLTPTHEGRQNGQHWPTPTKSKILGTIEFLEAQNIPYFKSAVFKQFGVTNRQGWRIIAEKEHPRRHHNDPFRTEKRGRPSKLTNQDISKMDRILQDYAMDGRILTWVQLAFEAGIEDISEDTVRRHMGSLYYRKCLACKKGWVSKSTANHQVDWACTQLSLHPDLEYWRLVRSSDEMHSGFSA
jgi:hypothetical protein